MNTHKDVTAHFNPDGTYSVGKRARKSARTALQTERDCGLNILREFTKDEIIQWISENGLFLRVSRREMLFIRWKMQSEQLSRDFQAELDRWDADKPDFAKRDALAVKFNNSTDRSERIRLLKQIEPYDKALKDHMALMRILDERQKKVDRVYRKMKEATQ